VMPARAAQGPGPEMKPKVIRSDEVEDEAQYDVHS
jgi:hypothetical protein